MIQFPNAKINLGLNVVAKRSDGYHNLETIFFPVPIFDALEVVVDVSLPSLYQFSSSGIVVDGDVNNNLCVKAYNLLLQDFNLKPVIIHLHKTIPMGGGLGGGSSDATSMLLSLNRLFELNLSQQQLIGYAVRLGADCPFFVLNQPCFATGIGEVLEPFSLSLAGSYLVLVNPNIHVSTAVAFANIMPKAPAISVKEIIRMPRQDWKGLLVNDFELSVFPVHPQIEKLKNSLYSDGAFYVSMSGSGSSVYALFDFVPDSISYNDNVIWKGLL